MSFYGVLKGETRELMQVWNQSFAGPAYLLIINIITPQDVIHYFFRYTKLERTRMAIHTRHRESLFLIY